MDWNGTKDLPLVIEPGVLDVLPYEVRTFIVNTLDQKCSVYHGWSWYEIGWIFGEKKCIRLCSTGIPHS